ncbi:MAG TPA: type IV pili methyl-accepting chemotaxis transducer N-terminal domain-containing protein, partial [Candidatus Brocadiales bacterium]|nr:type IV pili methyl-accepting chemotaxis transducer N-terminal domain-containing protein [Candidatus Brocadiales bacterium]
MKGISGKFLLIFGILLVLNVVNMIIFFASNQESDGRIINLAGKQRMLSQKMTKEALLLSRNGVTEEFRSLLKGTVFLFDRTLKGLADGDNELGLPPATNDKFLTQLGKVKAIWNNVKDNMDIILREEPGNPLFQKALDVVTSQNMPLLKEMNEAVTIYENIGRDKINFLRWANIAIIALNVLVITLAWVLVIRPLVKTLCCVIHDLRTGSERTVSASRQISASSQGLSQRTTEQASSIEKTTTTMEEMSSIVKQ